MTQLGPGPLIKSQFSIPFVPRGICWGKPVIWVSNQKKNDRIGNLDIPTQIIELLQLVFCNTWESSLNPAVVLFFLKYRNPDPWQITPQPLTEGDCIQWRWKWGFNCDDWMGLVTMGFGLGDEAIQRSSGENSTNSWWCYFNGGKNDGVVSLTVSKNKHNVTIHTLCWIILVELFFCSIREPGVCVQFCPRNTS